MAIETPRNEDDRTVRSLLARTLELDTLLCLNDHAPHLIPQEPPLILPGGPLSSKLFSALVAAPTSRCCTPRFEGSSRRSMVTTMWRPKCGRFCRRMTDSNGSERVSGEFVRQVPRRRSEVERHVRGVERTHTGNRRTREFERVLRARRLSRHASEVTSWRHP